MASRSKPRRKDSTLGGLLLKLDDKQEMDNIMSAHPSHWISKQTMNEMNKKSGPQQITQLLDAFRSAPASGATVYNKDTCADFHQLLVAVLFGYWRALVALQDAKKRTDGNLGDIRVCAEKLWHFTHLLWQIAHSGMIQYHFLVLEAGGKLFIPINTRMKLYTDWANKLPIRVEGDEVTQERANNENVDEEMEEFQFLANQD